MTRLLKFSLSSVLSFLIDNAVFAGGIKVLDASGIVESISIMLAFLVARSISANFNYYCNRRFVFSEGGDKLSYCKYWLLVVFVGITSCVLTEITTYIISAQGLVITICKIFVDVLMFFVSFVSQKYFVFRKVLRYE